MSLLETFPDRFSGGNNPSAMLIHWRAEQLLGWPFGSASLHKGKCISRHFTSRAIWNSDIYAWDPVNRR